MLRAVMAVLCGFHEQRQLIPLVCRISYRKFIFFWGFFGNFDLCKEIGRLSGGNWKISESIREKTHQNSFPRIYGPFLDMKIFTTQPKIINQNKHGALEYALLLFLNESITPRVCLFHDICKQNVMSPHVSVFHSNRRIYHIFFIDILDNFLVYSLDNSNGNEEKSKKKILMNLQLN